MVTKKESRPASTKIRSFFLFRFLSESLEDSPTSSALENESSLTRSARDRREESGYSFGLGMEVCSKNRGGTSAAYIPSHKTISMRAADKRRMPTSQ